MAKASASKNKKDLEIIISGRLDKAVLEPLESKYIKEISKATSNITIRFENIQINDISAVLFIFGLLKECKVQEKSINLKVEPSEGMDLLKKFGFYKLLDIMEVVNVN